MNPTQLKKILNPRVANEMQQICKPLLYATPINSFQFLRLFNDGYRIHLSTDPDWNELFFSKKLFHAAKLQQDPTSYQSGSFIWDHWSRDCPSYIHCGKIAEDIFDHAHGLSIVQKNPSYTDIFDIAVSKKSSNTDEFYGANIDLLQKFCQYFLLTANKLISESEQNKFSFQPTCNQNQYYSQQEIAKGLIIPDDFHITQKSDLYLKLTPREKQILAWLFQGKTLVEIAIILGISLRTLEKVMPRLKTKLDCQSLFQLGSKLTPIKHRLMLEEWMRSLY